MLLTQSFEHRRFFARQQSCAFTTEQRIKPLQAQERTPMKGQIRPNKMLVGAQQPR